MALYNAMSTITSKVDGKVIDNLVIDLDAVPDPFGKKRGLLARLDVALAINRHKSMSRTPDEPHIAQLALKRFVKSCKAGGLLPPDLVVPDKAFTVDTFKPFLTRCEEWMEDQRTSPPTDETTAKFAAGFQARDFLRKSSIIAGQPSLSEKSDQQWAQTLSDEKDMGRVNRRLLKLYKSGPKSESEAHVFRALEYTYQFLDRHLRHPKLEELCDRATFGPGTTNGSGSSIIEKLGSNGTSHDLICNEGMADVADVIMVRYFTGWAKTIAFGDPFAQSCATEDGMLRISVPAGDEKFSCVNKDWKSGRGIAPQTPFASLLQAGVGRVLEDCCARAGNPVRQHNDIQDPQEINRALALQASIDGKLATVDFSSASNRICTTWVRWAFGDLWRNPHGKSLGGQDCLSTKPQQWYTILSRLRARTIEAPSGDVLVLERFSAMGNGFTFPLMTLLLLGVARYACTTVGCDVRDVRVFGDDVLIPRPAVEVFLEVAVELGMVPNRNKTYVEGPFRESCGMDAFNGVVVTPYRFTVENDEEKGQVHDLDAFISMANGLHRASRRARYNGCLVSSLMVARDLVRESIMPLLRNNLMSSHDDGGDSCLVGYHPNEVLRANRLMCLYWRGIGITPRLIRSTRTTPLSDTDWTARSMLLSMLYYCRPSSRSLSGAFRVLTKDTRLGIYLTPGLPV